MRRQGEALAPNPLCRNKSLRGETKVRADRGAERLHFGEVVDVEVAPGQVLVDLFVLGEDSGQLVTSEQVQVQALEQLVAALGVAFEVLEALGGAVEIARGGDGEVLHGR